MEIDLSPPTAFVPPNPFPDMTSKFMDEKSADVVFEVENRWQRQNESNPTTVFHAHRSIIEEGAPTLFDFASMVTEGTPIPIADVDSPVFHNLLTMFMEGESAIGIILFTARNS